MFTEFLSVGSTTILKQFKPREMLLSFATCGLEKFTSVVFILVVELQSSTTLIAQYKYTSSLFPTRT